MKNLYKLKGAAPPLDQISVKHDMTKQEREQEKILQSEARLKNEENEDPKFKFKVIGLPWERRLSKVKKRETTETAAQDQATQSLEVDS